MAVSAQDVIVFQWSMVVVTFSLVLTRIYIRFSSLRSSRSAINNRASTLTISRPRPRWWTWSDFFVVVAWLGFVALAAIDTVHYHLGYLMMFQDHSFNIPWDRMQLAFKLQYIRDPEYFICMYAIKAAMLCFYHEFIPKERMFKAWLAMKMLCVITPLAWAYTTTMFLFSCVPVSQWWSSMEWPAKCWFNEPDISIFAIHIGTDFLIYILPLFVLYSVKSLSTPQKVQAGFMFFIGFFLIFITSAVYAVQTVPGWNENGTPLAAWILNTTEQSASIFVACAPAFKTWLVRGVFGRPAKPPVTKRKTSRDIESWGESTLVAGTVTSVREVEDTKIHPLPKGGKFKQIDEEIAEFDFGIQAIGESSQRSSDVTDFTLEDKPPRPLDDIEIESEKRFPSVIFRELTVDTGVDDKKCIMPLGSSGSR